MKKKLSIFLFLYLVLLFVSSLYRNYLRSKPIALPPDYQSVTFTFNHPQQGEHQYQIAYWDKYRGEKKNPPVLILLHGSPISIILFKDLVHLLSKKYRVICPYYPGYGYSSIGANDFSALHVSRVLAIFLEKLKIEQSHFVIYSFGGAVGLHYLAEHPDKVKSLNLHAAIGLQEYELMGDYFLNHMIHGGQHFAIWCMQNLTPHFGLLDRFPLNTVYTRSFYDTDQRLLKNIIKNIEVPVLIQHGRDDALVPYQVALAHHQLIKGSQLKIYDDGHMILLSQSNLIAKDIIEFLEQVEKNNKTNVFPIQTLITKQPEESKDYSEPLMGIALVVLCLIIIFSTFISEDLTLLGTGILIAKGIIGALPAGVAAFLGIYFGDLVLYGLGYMGGKTVIKWPPIKWLIKEEQIHIIRSWFKNKGIKVIYLSRLLPGSRLPTYLFAGMIHFSFYKTAFHFFIASILWTPLLLYFGYLAGGQWIEFINKYQNWGFISFILLLLGFIFLSRLISLLLTGQGRQTLLISWTRLTQFEFWPASIFYLPVIPYVFFLGLIRYRRPLLFLNANPGIDNSGFYGEKKSDIYQILGRNSDWIAEWELIENKSKLEKQQGKMMKDKLNQIELFAQKHHWPVVLKPDIGERGKAVSIIHNLTEARDYLKKYSFSLILQKYIPGIEIAVLYYRFPNNLSSPSKGKIYSMAKKEFLTIQGDGQKNIRELIFEHPRAKLMYKYFFKYHHKILDKILKKEEKFQLENVGSHCRGTLVLDSNHLASASFKKTWK